MVKLVQEYAEARAVGSGMVPFSPSWFAFVGASRLFRYLSDCRVSSHKSHRRDKMKKKREDERENEERSR